MDLHSNSGAPASSSSYASPAQPAAGSASLSSHTRSFFLSAKRRLVSVFPPNISLSTYLLFIVYGIGSWITVNGLFSELPLIVNDLPEGWAAASDISLVIQVANVGPMLYLLVQNRVSLKTANVVVLLIGAASMCVLAFVWNITTRLPSGSTHSVALMALVFTAALCDCTTSLIFYPFVATFHHHYVPALTAGEGLSGLAASILTWIQNSPEHGLLFSPTVFFFLLAVLLCFSLIAFLLLHRIPADDPRRVGKGDNVESAAGKIESAGKAAGNSKSYELDVDQVVLKSQEDKATMKDGKDNSNQHPLLGATLHPMDILPELALIFWLSFLQNGVKPSISSYATGPYGNRAYHWATNLSLCIDPAFASLTLIILSSRRTLSIYSLAFSGMVGYMLYIALQSPSPPLRDDDGGATLIVLAAALSAAGIAYVKATCVRRLQRVHEVVSIPHVHVAYAPLPTSESSLSTSTLSTHTPSPSPLAFLSQPMVHRDKPTPIPSLLATVLTSDPLRPRLLRVCENGHLPTLLGVTIQLGSLSGALIFYFLVNYTTIFQQ